MTQNNYLRTSLYHAFVMLKGFRFYAILNVICLALCLACVISVSMFIYRESTVNDFNTRKDRIFSVTNNNHPGRNYMILDSDFGDISFNYDLIPDIEATTKVAINGGSSIIYDDEEFVVDVMTTDTSFFHVFDLPLSTPLLKNPLSFPTAALLSKSFATKIFGDEDPVGKIITWSGTDFTINGICEMPPQKSSFDFDVIIPAYNMKWAGLKCSFQFFLLDDPEKVQSVEQKLFAQYSQSKNFNETNKITLSPFNDFDKFLISNYLFYLIPAILILVIGVVNFAGCYYILTLRRGKELGMKKIFGARRIHVYGQFFFECFFIVLISTALAFLLVESAKPYLLEYFSMKIEYLWGFIAVLLAFILIVLPAFLALVPFLRYRNETPIDTMKKINMIGKTNARTVFVTIQVAITIILIVCTLFFSKQLTTLLHTETGIDTENVIVVGELSHPSWCPFQEDFYTKKFDEGKRNKALIVKKLEESPFIENYVLGGKIFNQSDIYNKFRANPDDPFIPILFRAHYDCQSLDFYGVELLEGYLPTEAENDMHHAVITESAKKQLKINDISTQQIEISESYWDEDIHYQVVGVIKDIMVDQIPYGNKAIIFNSNIYSSVSDGFSVRYQAGKEKETLALLQEIFGELRKNADYQTLQEEYESLYESNKSITILFIIFTGITIIVSAMGLFILSFYDIRQRYREIALRKINGATAKDIINLLIKKYLWMLLIASAVAIPVAVFIITELVKNIGVTTPMSWWIFVLAEIITIAIVMGTLIWQTIKAARENPVEAMRKE